MGLYGCCFHQDFFMYSINQVPGTILLHIAHVCNEKEIFVEEQSPKS